MLPNRLAAALRTAPTRRLLAQSSRSAIALTIGALALPAVAQAQAQPFQSMIAMQAGQMTLPDGTVSVWSGAERPVIGNAADGRPLMTIQQTRQKALLDWEQFRLQTNEILEFQQQSADWIAVNRVHGAQAAQIDGELRGKGRIFIFNDNGVLLGKDAKVNVRQLVTGSGVKDVNVDGATTTLVQSGSKAIVNWSDMSSQAGEVLRIAQERKDWVMLNRSLTPGTTVIGGTIEADGQIVLSAPGGLAINGKIKAQQVIAAALGVRDDQFALNQGLLSYARDYNNRTDPTFSNTWNYGSVFDGDPVADLLLPPPSIDDPSDPLRFKMTIGATGSIETNSYGKVMLFGPAVTNRGLISVKDEGQVILAAGDNIYLTGDGKNVSAWVGAYNPLATGRINLPYRGLDYVSNAERQRFWQEAFGETYAIGSYVPGAAARVEAYLNKVQADRIASVGFHARNEGIIRALRGGSVSFRGHNLEQMGAIEMTSTALFRGSIDFRTQVYDYREYPNNDQDGPSTGNGDIVFGKGSLTQITPDLDSTDAIALNSGPQSVGSLTAIAAHLHMQEDSMIYMPSGSMSVLLDARSATLGSNRGAGANQDNESGVRFMMESGATIDLSGWKSTVLPMGYHQVTGRLFAAQLADSPLQRDGALYRKEITIDRRYGTDVADWASFDNLSQGTLAQFLLNGGTFQMDLDDDFIMKSGSMIDVSGGKITYEKGFVYTTLLRTLDNRIIDIREASPDTLYMGLANEWTRYDVKWGKQKTYYIPFMSSTVGRYEDGYEQGGAGGLIEILAPDVVLQGTLKGGVTIGKYQRGNLPKAGAFVLNDAGESESEYVPNNLLISRIEQLLPKDFGLKASLADVYGDFFGEEYDGSVPIGANGRRSDNAMMVGQDFFNRSTMGSYFVRQDGRTTELNPYPPADGLAVRVEQGVNLNLANGASFEIEAGERMSFLGSIRTEGGAVKLSGLSIVMGEDSRIDTRGSWYNDLTDTGDIADVVVPRIDGGSISIAASNAGMDVFEDVSLVLPETMVIDSSGGGWIDGAGNIRGGKGGAISISATIQPEDTLDLGGLANARAYGLGGNGAYTLSTLAPIVIADTLPEEADPGSMLVAPSFFEGSGFSSIRLAAPSVTIPEDVQVEASAGALVLRVPGLTGGVSYLDFASGSDIYDVAEVKIIPLEQRSAALRQGMKIELPSLVMGEGSLLSTEARGTISANGADIAGTILAPAGAITLNNGVLLRETAKLLAPGAVLVTSRDVAGDGRVLTDGVVLPGGTISLSAIEGLVEIEKGAVLDVSGASATFDVPTPVGSEGVTMRTPTLVASDGGSIEISARDLAINDATYLAHAGGPTARGGALSINWEAIYRNPGGSDAGGLLDQLETYFTYGYFYDVDGNILTTLYGTDLSRVRWSDWGLSISFPAGYRIDSREALVSQFDKLTAAAAGVPPMFVIGDPAKLDLPTIEAPTIDAPILELFGSFFGYTPPVVVPSEPSFTSLSPEKISIGGFSAVSISASPGIIFTDGVTLGGRKSDGSYVLDQLSINSPRLIGSPGANVRLEANIVRLGASSSDGETDQGLYDAALGSLIDPTNANTAITLQAGTLIDVSGGNFYGWGQSNLFSGGDIRLRGGIVSPGELVFKADQLYAATAADVAIVSDQRIRILAQDDGGKLNGTPYEAAAKLSFRAPLIEQGGIVRSPLGAINFEAVGDDGTVRLLPGSITSVNADGHLIPYGRLSNGDTWLDPLSNNGTGELRALPAKAINITGANIDLQTGATLDVAGSGDLYAREFIPGLGGSNDWLTGYRDSNYDWVDAPGEIFAVIPDFEGDIAPIGLSGAGANIPVGSKIYLSGGSGLKAGYYTLLPAEYAILPGAYRVTAKHHYAGNFSDMPLGEVGYNPDGSTVQAGYRYIAGQAVRDQRNSGFLVMNGDTLRTRSEYAEAFASSFFTSEAFLKKALRTNQPIGEVPRIPIDGGSVVLTAGKQLNLNATLKSAAAKGGRGGFADINAPRLAVVGANTDRSQYEGYLLLDSDALNRFGAESLLLGGVRRQGNVNLELTVGATDVVVDNAGSVLAGPELLLAASNGIRIEKDAALETRGQISGSSGDLRVLPSYAAFTDDRGTPFDPADDIVHPAYDQGTLLRLSSSEQVDVLRNLGAVDALQALFADPQRLEAVNASRARFGLAPLAPAGTLTIVDGARLTSSRALAMDTTGDISLAGGATLATKQISAAASRVSIGEVPAGIDGLVFSGGSLGALASAEDIALRSYSTIDFYGTSTLRASAGLTLDTREIRALGDASDLVTVAAKTLTIANGNGGTVSADAGAASMVLSGENVRFSGGDKAISGVKALTIEATQRVIGSDEGTLFTPGALSVKAGGITADSGSRLFFDAGGAISLASSGGELAPFSTFGATIGFTGSSIESSGRIALTGGIVNLRARDGDVVLANGSSVDVTSSVSRIFDVDIGVGAGTVNLISDRGSISLAPDAVIDVSGSAAGGDAGSFTASAGLGQVTLGAGIKGTAANGYRAGSFGMQAATLGDFGALNAALDSGGFFDTRRFEFNQGDATITGTIRVRDFSMVANDGSISLAGTIQTLGDNGGRVQLAAAESVNLLGTGRIVAKANAADGSGGTVLLETVGRNGGRIDLAAGSMIDVSGTGDGGRLVRLRAPQIGNDMAIGQIGGTITGARQVLAEAFRVYEDVSVIDQPMIDRVEGDAAQFMTNAPAIQARLGSGISIAPGIELRSDGDMTLETDWDLHDVRFGGAAGVLTLRAAGDLKLDANLSDGFSTPTAAGVLQDGPSWTFNLTSGANVTSPNSLAVLPTGLLESGKGSIIVGGTPDTIEYFYDPAYGNENRLYRKNPLTGRFIRDGEDLPYSNPHLGWIELERDGQGRYIDPTTGLPIAKDPATGDYTDTLYYARRPLPTLFFDDGGGYDRMSADGVIVPGYIGNNVDPVTARGYLQWDNSTGYLVRTGTAGINIATGRDLVLQYRPSVIYTAGENAAPLAGFSVPLASAYPVNGGDLSISVTGSIIGADSPQLPSGWLIGRSLLRPDGIFAPGEGREFEQSTWYVDFSRYQAGVGALGGGNVDISAGGDIINLSVNLPTTGRASGNTQPNEPLALTITGGGDLTMRAGGNIGSGKFYVADGLGLISAGGAFTATGTVTGWRPGVGSGAEDDAYGRVYYYIDPSRKLATYDLHTLLYTSSGEFRLQSGGDMDIEAVLDPLMPNPRDAHGFVSYTPDAKVSLFSAGGDITLWNNGANIDLARVFGDALNPTAVAGSTTRGYVGESHISFELWPATASIVAAAGDINVLGGLLMAPAPQGTLDLLARGDVHIGNATRVTDQFVSDPDALINANFRSGFGGIILSQSYMELMQTPDSPKAGEYYTQFTRDMFLTAGPGQVFDREFAPILHVGDTQPVRIYAGDDIISSAAVNLPKAGWFQAGGDVYFPNFTFQHNNLQDFSLVRAGAGLYFNDTNYITVNGPGRLEIETGGDLWIPSNGNGISSNWLTLPDTNPYDTQPAEILNPDQKAADIGISVGFNQRPDVEAFEASYLDPNGSTISYLLKDAGDGKQLSYYLFDRLYTRGDIAPDSVFFSTELRAGFVNYIRERQGLSPLDTPALQAEYLETAWDFWRELPAGDETPFDQFFPSRARAGQIGGEFYLPNERQGLVNYVRQLQGLEALKTQDEQRAYLDTAWTYWEGLTEDFKTPFLRDVMYLELRTTGREANAPDNDRYNTTFRGYDAIKTLFPGAEKRATETLGEGESRWKGDFETYASRVLSNGGGKIDVMVPGGALKLANIAATPDDTGQPPSNAGRGDALRAGLVTANGGAINIFTHDSVTVNQSRILTALGGDMLIWSSYGDIAAGKGAKTSISPTFYNYTLDMNVLMNRTPAGLPTGAGIGTVASIPGAPVADVDLVAPNGIVDAGDAGIRVSGNFNVFAVQILGTDNIDVSGISTGLPAPPATPLGIIQPTETDAQSRAIANAVMDQVKQVSRNKGLLSPSIIEVRVTGFGEACADCDQRAPIGGGMARAPQGDAGANMAEARAPTRLAENRHRFDIVEPTLSDAVVAVGRMSRANIVYDRDELAGLQARPVRGSMTTEQALTTLVRGSDVNVRKIGDNSYLLKGRTRRK